MVVLVKIIVMQFTINDRFNSKKRLVLSMQFFHSFQERTTSIFDLANRYMDESAKEKFYFAYRIQMNHIYLREALVNIPFHKTMCFEQNELVTTGSVMSIADTILFGVCISELDSGAIPIETFVSRNSVADQKVRFYQVLFEHVFLELCLLVKQSFLFVGTGLFLRVLPYRNNIVLEVGCSKDPERKHKENLALARMKSKQLKDVKTIYKKVFDKKLFVVSNQNQLFFRIEL